MDGLDVANDQIHAGGLEHFKFVDFRGNRPYYTQKPPHNTQYKCDEIRTQNNFIVQYIVFDVNVTSIFNNYCR